MHRFFISAALLALALPTAAQWSTTPSSSSVVANGASDQAQPKVVSSDDGGSWVSWFDGIGSGFDMRVQKLDATGAATLTSSGVLVADRGFSSTQDYGLATSVNGEALLAFRDDSGTGTQISAARVASDGTLVWGAGNVQLTNTGAFVAAPKIAAASDGGAYVAWTQNNDVRMQRLTAAGTKAWVSDVVFTTTGSYNVADMHASGTGVIISLVSQAGGFGSARRLHAQRVDNTGASTWNASPTVIFDTGSLQFGNFPTFAPDGLGGAVFSWYDAGSGQLQCYAQRLRVDGSAAFPMNGVAVSTDATRVRVSPDAVFDASTLELTVAWREQSANQALSGIYAQRFNETGSRLWGSNGLEIVALGSDTTTEVTAVASGTSTFVFWEREPSFGQATLEGARTTQAGTINATFDIATTVSGKQRLDAARTTNGDAVLVWADTLVDAGDIFGQNVQCDTTLGPVTPGAAWTDLGQGLAGAGGTPTLTGTGTLCPDTPALVALTGAAPGANAVLVVGFSEINASFKGGTLVPSPDILVSGLATNGSGATALPFQWPSLNTTGLVLTWQAWIPDAGGPANFAASNALRSTSP